MKLSNKVYGFLKAFTLIVLPAAGTFYFTMAATWHLPHQQDVVGSIAALTTFLGTVLHISSATYKPPTDGNLVIDKSHPDKDVYSLELSTAVEELAGKSQITLGVGPKKPITPPVPIPPSS
jgi:hypothetical protein